jgi:hypothetical protein
LQTQATTFSPNQGLAFALTNRYFLDLGSMLIILSLNKRLILLFVENRVLFTRLQTQRLNR